ncbi:type III intermediate filament [Echeneis naucrates]|uniref:type III intermediate filament n=1 Tax=Echeneis naucrates TaxID=173247 RepID=UPI001113970C|nr:type III intermediate filament-like [Echeneis naucrates]
MAMLRVSSYRRLFEDESRSRNTGLGIQCAGQYRAPARGVAVDDCDCDKLDFVAAKSLNKEGLSRFVQDRTVISALNNRLVRLIELARCFEKENESLEYQIVELEEILTREQPSSSIAPTVAHPDCSLDAVVERLRRERDEILCDMEKLQEELERLKANYEKAAEHRIFFQQKRQDVAEEVDAVTAECLALREQVAIYEGQLANMEAQHKTAVENLLEPADVTPGTVPAIRFSIPDITSALDVKEYYCQLAESLQLRIRAAVLNSNKMLLSTSPSAVALSGDAKQLQVEVAAGPLAKDLAKTDEMKKQIPELQKELAELEKRNEELEDEIEIRKAAYMDEIAELESTIDEMQHQQADLQAQMKEQCEDYKELLREKMARDLEIVAYRDLVEEEENRMCNL